MTVILTGFMGTGKTTVGKQLAQRLGLPFIDTDAEIERAEGRTISAIFAADGESRFRAIEKDVLRQALGEEAVIATGGGAIVDRANYERMRAAGPIICLVAEPEVIFQRTAANRDRPLLFGDSPRERIRELLAARAEAYARADHTVDTSRLAVGTIVEQILAFLRRKESARDAS
jgi:shikimate kinase